PVRLRRRDVPATGDAVLILSASASALAAVCRSEHDRLPKVFAVRGGVLLVGPEGSPLHAIAGTIRPERLAGDPYLAADADLLPALLPEEMVGLTRSQGLVLLPGGEALGFDAANPLPVSRWLAPAHVARGGWQAFPQPPDIADRLTAIEGPPSPVA